MPRPGPSAQESVTPVQMLEFQAKELLNRFDIATPRGRIAAHPDEAMRIARRLAFERYVVKAQVPAGDRRAAGGVRFAASPDGVKATSELMLGKVLVTAQTGRAGELVKWVLIEEAVEPVALLYAAVVLERATGSLELLASGAGGDDIEARAGADPHLIQRETVRLAADGPVADYTGLAGRLGVEPVAAGSVASLLERLARAAVALDATLFEINPLALMADGRLIALDAKLTIDDNALARHPALAALRAATEIEDGDPEVLGADRHHLNYQRMDGEIGVVVNGAGLALATLDMLVEAGGRPANFMDIRTTAQSLDVAYGLELVLANPKVKALLVNVHGGGMQRCDTIAEGVGVAMRRHGRSLPIVVRLAGNNADFARVRLQSYGLAFEEGCDMLDAVQRVVAAAAKSVAA